MWWKAFFILIVGPSLDRLAIVCVIAAIGLFVVWKAERGSASSGKSKATLIAALVFSFIALVSVAAILTDAIPKPPPIGSDGMRELDEALFSPIVERLNGLNK
jgi:hypothetical protein